MKVNIVGVYLVDYKTIKDLEIKKLNLSDDDLSSFSKQIAVPSINRLPSIDTRDKSIFATATRFKVDILEDSDYLFFLKLFYDKIKDFDNKEIRWLESVNNLFSDDNKFQPNLILYKVEKEHNEDEIIDCLYVHSLKKSMMIKNKALIFGRGIRKDVESKATEFNLLSEAQFLALPDKEFICSIERIKNEEETSLKVFKAFELDTVFNIESLIDSYAEKKINRFVNHGNGKEFKLTSDKSEVLFYNIEGKDVKDDVVAAITGSNNLQLKKTYASFSGRSNKTIQTIKLTRLEKVVNSLIGYVRDHKNETFFRVEEIPRIDLENNCIYVDDQSVKIFAAMLNNEIIQKLLDERIEIPYYQI